MVLASWSAFGAARARAQLGVKLATAWLSPHPLAAHHRSRYSRCRYRLFPGWFAPVPAPVQQALRCSGDALVPALPADVEAFFRQGPPPVILTPGSFMRQARGFFEAGLEGLRPTRAARDLLSALCRPGTCPARFRAALPLYPRAAAGATRHSHGPSRQCRYFLAQGLRARPSATAGAGLLRPVRQCGPAGNAGPGPPPCRSNGRCGDGGGSRAMLPRRCGRVRPTFAAISAPATPSARFAETVEAWPERKKAATVVVAETDSPQGDYIFTRMPTVK